MKKSMFNFGFTMASLLVFSFICFNVNAQNAVTTNKVQNVKTDVAPVSNTKIGEVNAKSETPRTRIQSGTPIEKNGKAGQKQAKGNGNASASEIKNSPAAIDLKDIK